MGNIFIDLPVPAFNGVGAAIDTSALGATKTIVVGGPFQGTITIEYANDDAAAFWAPVPNGSFVSNPGRVTIDLAVKWMRATMSAYKGGLANADVGASNVLGGGFFVPLGPAALDISNMPPFKTVVASGACNVEISEDGTSWSQAFSFQNKGGQSGTIVAKFARVTGGASAWLGATDLEDDDNEIIPPFPVPQISTIIYARPTGNDETGTGTLENPYATFQRAVRDVPYIQMPGYLYTVDITGIGTETLPEGYDLPSWVSGHANGGDGFAVTITADHELALPPAESEIAAGTMNTDPDTGMFSVEDLTKTWTPGALKGLFVFGTNGDGNPELAAVIHDNTATEIFVTSNEGGDWAFPFSIRKCSATLQGASSGAFSGMITVAFVHSLAINGIAIIPTDPGDTGFAQQGGHVWFTGCHLVNARLQSGVRFHGLEICNLVAPGIAGETYLKSSRIADAGVVDGSWISRSANQGLAIFRGTCVDGCTTITCFETSSVNSGVFGGILNISNVLIKNSIGDAVYWPGGNASLKDTKIENAVANGPDSPGDAFVGEGGVLAVLEHVTGVGNAGVGIHAFNGAQISADAATTVVGAAGAIQIGGNAPVVAYPVAPYNVNDPNTFTRVFDPTFV